MVKSAVTFEAVESLIFPLKISLHTKTPSLDNLKYNLECLLQCGDGRQRPFEVVPFMKEIFPLNIQYVSLLSYKLLVSLPICLQHNLPLLNNEAQIDALLDHEAVAYLMGYNFLPIPQAPAARKRAIRIQIGCSVGLDVQNYCKCIHSCQPI